MATNAQFVDYAAYYDLLYKDKDYQGEANYIDELLSRYLPKEKSATSLIDLACGTGKHLFELSEKGYGHLCGSDIATAMIDIAGENAILLDRPVSFYNHSFQEAHKIDRRFDVVISMFSAFNYLTTYADQSKALSNIHGLLEKDGIFVFDYWNGCAVTELYSPVKVLRKKKDNTELIRVSETSLDLVAQSATVKFTCSFFEGDQRVSEFVETHHLHYYYFAEMMNLLRSHKFEVLYVSPFMQPDKPVQANDWNISIVTRKIS